MRYRLPVPLDTPLRLTGRMTESGGRRTTVVGTIATEDDPERSLVEATGVFVSPSEATSGTYFGAVRTASGRQADGRLGTDMERHQANS